MVYIVVHHKHISLAPMMDYTDRYFRFLVRLLSKNIILYTEMITAHAICYGDHQQLLQYDASEHPLILQLGGSDPEFLYRASMIAAQYQYDGLNLNVGCPSPRVKKGSFGACLFKEPELVSECVDAMKSAFKGDVTVKTRLGVDDMDRYDDCINFVDHVRHSGCQHFIIHARKAWLQGLSPKENREIPELKYEWVYALKKYFPDLEITLNGGVKDIDSIRQHLRFVDGVMIGREAYHNPYWLALIDQELLGQSVVMSRKSIILEYLDFAYKQLDQGVDVNRLARPLIGMFQGVNGAKKWRRMLSTKCCHKAGILEPISHFIESL